MTSMSRRKMLVAATAGSVLTAGTALGQAIPQPIAGAAGATDPGPRNIPIDRENPDILSPPTTDDGDLPNLKWSFSLSHERLLPGGWARETTTRELPVSKEIAGVDMRLLPGAIRELHWHKADEWALMLNGNARITAVDSDGRNSISDVEEGELWYFPGGVPHSIQALSEGCEFLLVFDDGDFSEDNTFLITEWLAHVPKEVLAKNFGVPESAFANIPKEQLYIFEAPVPPPLARDIIADPNGQVPNPFSFKLMGVAPIKSSGGQVRIVDSRTFKASRNIAAALVEIEPGGMRELHWHPLADEWQYYISGQARMTVFGSGVNSRTFDYQAGDVGYVPRPMGHYVENIGDTAVRYLEMFKSPVYSDVSLDQWMALVPPELVKEHLKLADTTIAMLRKEKALVVGPGARSGIPA